MKYKAVIFDLDGVICHTDQYHYQAWKQVADELGIYFDQSINNRLRGVSRKESFEIILERCGRILGEAEKESCTEKKNEIYKALLTNMNTGDLSPEVKSVLDELKGRGIKLAIGSSSRNAEFILGRLGLKGYFDAVSDGNKISRSKPDPEVFLLAARLLGEEAKDCLVVEDARAGIEAAHAGGMAAAAMGDARECGLAEYELASFGSLLQACN